MQKYFEAMLMEKNTQDSTIDKIDLQNMLELNQLLATFETDLFKTTQDIIKFWNNLIFEKETTKLYS